MAVHSPEFPENPVTAGWLQAGGHPAASVQEGGGALARLLSDVGLMAMRMGDAPVAMMSLLHGAFAAPRCQWWMLPGQPQAVRSNIDFSLCEDAVGRADAVTEIEDLHGHTGYADSAMKRAMPDLRFCARVTFGHAGGDYLGTLCLFDHAPRRLSDAQRDMLQLLAQQLASQLDMQLEIQRLQCLALTDPLTGVGNRRAFDQHLRQEWGRHLRSGAPLSLLMLDVNLFKQYNDTHGHQAGDAALARLGQLLPMPLRSSDFVSRYGGDEFAIILPDTPEPGAALVSERIQHTLSHASWPLQALGVSIGVASLPAGGHCDFQQLTARADEAMYVAKRRT